MGNGDRGEKQTRRSTRGAKRDSELRLAIRAYAGGDLGCPREEDGTNGVNKIVLREKEGGGVLKLRGDRSYGAPDVGKNEPRATCSGVKLAGEILNKGTAGNIRPNFSGRGGREQAIKGRTW